MSDDDGVPLRFATPRKRRRLASSSSSSSDSVRISTSARKTRKLPSDSEADAAAEEARLAAVRQDERRRLRAQERALQRERERELEKRIVSSLKKKSREEVEEQEFVHGDEEDEDEDDDVASFIHANLDDLLTSSSSEAEADETAQDALLAHALSPLLEIASLTARVQRVLGLTAPAVSHEDDWEPDQKWSAEELLEEDAAGVTRLDLLILDEQFTAVADLPRVCLTGRKSIDPVRLAVRALVSSATSASERRLLGAWLGYFAACAGDCAHAVAEVLAVSDDAATVRLLAGDGEGMSLVHKAAMWGRPECLAYLVEAREYRDLRVGDEPMGSTPLHLAAVGETASHTECVEVLLSLIGGGDCVLFDKAGWPPLLYALQIDNKATVQRLLEFDLMYGDVPQLTRCVQLASDAHAALPVRRLLRTLGSDVHFFRALNVFVAKDVRVLSGPLRFLLRSGEQSPVDVDNKRQYLRLLLAEARDVQFGSLEVHVERERVLESVCAELARRADAGQLRTLGTRVVWYIGGRREGSMGPGPQKEFESVVDASLRQDGAFSEVGPFLFPTGEDAAVDYVGVGRVLGVWLLQGKTLQMSSHIYPGVFEYIVDGAREKTLEDLAEIDEELYRHLKWLQDTNIADIEDELVVCTERTKHVYIAEQVRLKTYNPNFDKIKQGFLDVVHADEVGFLSGKEMAVVLGGGERNAIDVDEWRRRTKRSGVLEEALVEWFWDFVRKLSQGEQALLLQFATGRFYVPAEFILVGTTASEERLPSASTCMNLLSLPQYRSRAKLEQMLLIAIRCGASGYTFA